MNADTLKNQTFMLLANYRLPDVIEMISLIVERNQLSNMASGKSRAAINTNKITQTRP